jgi:hypothetical protein
MPLQRGEVQGYDFNRMVVEFTMLNQDKVILCAISTAAMDDLEERRDVKPEERVRQFKLLREAIEERAPPLCRAQPPDPAPPLCHSIAFHNYASGKAGGRCAPRLTPAVLGLAARGRPAAPDAVA